MLLITYSRSLFRSLYSFAPILFELYWLGFNFGLRYYPRLESRLMLGFLNIFGSFD